MQGGPEVQVVYKFVFRIEGAEPNRVIVGLSGDRELEWIRRAGIAADIERGTELIAERESIGRQGLRAGSARQPNGRQQEEKQVRDPQWKEMVWCTQADTVWQR